MRLGPRPRPVRTDLPPQFHVTIHEDNSTTVEQRLSPEAIDDATPWRDGGGWLPPRGLTRGNRW